MRVLLKEKESGLIALVEADDLSFDADDDIPTLRKGIRISRNGYYDYVCEIPSWDTKAEKIIREALVSGAADLSDYLFEVENEDDETEEKDDDECSSDS